MYSPRRIVALLFCFGPNGCATAPSKTVFVAPTDLNIVLQQENGIGLNKARVAFISNMSSVPVTVTGVTVNSCVNVKQHCGPNKLDIRVPPGQRREVLRLEPENTNATMSYGFRYSWRGEGVRQAETVAKAAAGDTAAMSRMAGIAHQDEIRKRSAVYNDVALYPSALLKLGSNFAGIRAVPDSFVLNVGDVMFTPELRVVGVDKSGNAIGRVYANTNYLFYGGKVFEFVKPDTLRALAPGRAVISIRVTVPGDTARASFAPVVVTLIVK